jgi:2-isopropylmalate synthase
VDAAYKAIDSLVRIDVKLLDYSVTSVTAGIDAIATTRVLIKPSGKMAGEGFAEDYKGNQVQKQFSGQTSYC